MLKLANIIENAYTIEGITISNKTNVNFNLDFICENEEVADYDLTIECINNVKQSFEGFEYEEYNSFEFGPNEFIVELKSGENKDSINSEFIFSNVKDGNKIIDTVKYDSGEMYLLVERECGASGISVNYKQGFSQENIINSFVFALENKDAKSIVTTKLTSDGEVKFDVNLTIIGTWLSEGTVEFPGYSVTIASNVNVNISNAIKNRETIDVTYYPLEYIMYLG